ncbi:MAG: methyl-accepting chemotaxis protein [Treponema sp.]|nr:methyl-accepting chemotaxis protein [Treponema sp.]
MKLQTKILIFFSAIIVLLSIVITVLSIRNSLEVASLVFSREGIEIAQRAAAPINGDRFQSLSRSLNDSDPFYEEMRTHLYNLWDETGVFYLYTIGPDQDGVLRYIIDGSGLPGSDTFSDLGDEIYEGDYGAPFFRTWETGVAQHTTLERSDWGYLISVYIPLLNSRNEVVGILGCDFDGRFLFDLVLSLALEQIFFALIFMLTGLAFMWLLTRSLFKRLHRISMILSVLAGGEGNLSSRIDIKQKDEIGEMAELFNQTLDRICNMVALVKNQTQNLSNVGDELSSNMTQTEGAVTEISGTIGKIKEHVINQSASVTETNATMEKVVENIGRLNTQVEVQAESVAHSSAAIEEMIASIGMVTETLIKNSENVERLTAASDLGRESLDGVSRDIQEIARESEDILEINKVMQTIASQTNLLSMNAAIEAAHAGQAGMGFAVVAEEIRKLADSSSQQSRTISTVLRKIKESIDGITRSILDVLRQFQDIGSEVQIVSDQEADLRRAMEEQKSGSHQILEAISRLQDITRQVKDGSVEMLEGSKEVIKESQDLAQAAQEINQGINDIASGADNINSAVLRVHLSSNNNKEHIKALSEEVHKFIIDQDEGSA